MSIMIIDNYDSFTFNLYQLVSQICRQSVSVFKNDEITLQEIKSSNPSHIIISPGPGHPGNDSDFGVCQEIIQNYSQLDGAAILGVCLGHQGIVHHMGGKVIRAPYVVHGKQSEILQVCPSPLLTRISQTFRAMRYHSLIAEEESLPACLQILARDFLTGLIMAVAHKSAPIYGIQFHPESIGTPDGRIIMENFLDL